jgi:hypothetical protein
MAQPGCTGPTCKYTGSRLVSDATPGRCTGTGGYISNAEIDELIGQSNTQSWYDADSDSDMAVYNGMCHNILAPMLRMMVFCYLFHIDYILMRPSSHRRSMGCLYDTDHQRQET